MSVFKIGMLSLVTILSFTCPASVFGAQTIDCNPCKLESALNEVSEHYAVLFSYKNSLVENVEVNFDIKEEESFESALERLLKNVDLTYKAVDSKYYLLYSEKEKGKREIRKMERKIKSLSKLEKNSRIQLFKFQRSGKVNSALIYSNLGYRVDGIDVRGSVVDESGNPLIGVNIVVKGTGRGTSTDMAGRFSLDNVDEDAVLVVSYIGFVSQEIPADNHGDLTIVMTEDSSKLEEVVVVAYREQSKSSYTGSAVDLNVQRIESNPLASFQDGLQGQVAGLQLSTPTGQPGAVPDVRIRGVGSINAGSDPLYVIDGIPVVAGDISRLANSSNTIAGLNPRDIATLTVLKDASATAIYGSRGANGVILITTKKGQAGKTKFDFNTQYGMSEMLLPDRNKPLRTNELSELLIEGRVNTGESRAAAEEYIYSRIDKNIDTDWLDVIARRGLYRQYNLSAGGGNDKTSIYTSLGYFDQDAVIIGIDFRKLNAKLNVTHKATDRLTMDVGLSLSNQKLHTNSDAGAAANPVRAMVRVVPWESVYNEDGSYNTDILLTYNPVGMVDENIRETKLYGILGNLGLNYKITEELSIESRGNVNFDLADEFQYDNPYFGAGRNDGGLGRSYDNKVLNYNITNLLKYDHSFNSDHSLNLMLGQEAQKISRNYLYAYVSNYGAPGLTTLANASVYMDATNELTSSSISSYFFNASYLFQSRFVLNATLRRDGSSRFGSEVRYANFGSLGLAWNISSESFLAGSSHIDILRLRTSYGINGNQDIGNFASRGLYRTGEDYNGQPGYVYSQQSNPLLTWEKNKPFNIGVDFSIFGRLDGTVEYYTRTTSDLLFNVPISATNGITSYMANIGEMKNSGWEVALNSENIRSSGGFGWMTNLNFTTNKNVILKLDSDEPIIDTRYIREVGGDFYTFYMPGYAGVDPANGEALWYSDESETGTTNKYSDAKPFKQGSALPKFYAGLTNTLSFKNLSLSFMLYLNYGNKVYDFWGRYTSSDGSALLNDRGNMTRNIYENRWQNPGDITDVPKVVWGNTQSGLSSQHSSRFIYDGTYVRLRDISLSYKLPDEVISKLSINNLRLYVKGTNFATWTKDKKLEMDPDTGLAGSADLTIPISKQILVGLDFSF